VTQETLTHVTRDGDRWDLLAADYYGSAFALGLLLEANPAHATLPTLPAGLRLAVPVVEPETAAEQSGSEAKGRLVPWR